jgi:hypothetical protein
MAKFLDKIVGEYADDGIEFTITKPFRYVTDIDPASFGYSDDKLDIDPETGLRRLIIVPEGFVTNFASTPKILWSIAPSIGRHSKGALIHDWLYTCHKEGRPWADRVFAEACELNGSSWFIKKTYPLMVRIFGRSAWDASN